MPHADDVVHSAVAAPGSVPNSLGRDEPEVGRQPDDNLGFSQEPPATVIFPKCDFKLWALGPASSPSHLLKLSSPTAQLLAPLLDSPLSARHWLTEHSTSPPPKLTDSPKNSGTCTRTFKIARSEKKNNKTVKPGANLIQSGVEISRKQGSRAFPKELSVMCEK